jgi:hypothetical protein
LTVFRLFASAKGHRFDSCLAHLRKIVCIKHLGPPILRPFVGTRLGAEYEFVDERSRLSSGLPRVPYVGFLHGLRGVPSAS